MTQIDIEDDYEDNENESVSFGQPVVVSRRGSKKDISDTPIENAADIPLFEDSDKRGLRSATYLKVIKLDKPGAGYKGQVPLTSTLETIGQLYGDGIYNIEACNHKHQILRSKENIRISLTEPNSENAKLTSRNGSNNDIQLISQLNAAHAEEIKRTREISERVANESIVQSKQHTELVRTTSESAAAREREFMQSAQKNQQDFFGNLMIAQSQMFQQTMAMITMGHQQTMESLRATTEREMNSGSNNVEVLMKGLSLGREMAGGDDSPDWLKALDKGGNMMKDLLQLKTDNQSPIPNQTTPQKQRDPNRKSPLTRSELLEIIRLKKSLNAKGIDFESMVKQTREHLSNDGSNQVATSKDSEEATSNDNEESTDEDESEQTE
jgi:hypothetical protein